MVRVVVLAWAIGAAFSANAFSTANTLPNSLFLLIGGGVLNAVLVPADRRAPCSARTAAGVRRPAAHAVARRCSPSPRSWSRRPRRCSCGSSGRRLEHGQRWRRRRLRVLVPAPGLLLRALHGARAGAQRPRQLRALHVGTGRQQRRRDRRAWSCSSRCTAAATTRPAGGRPAAIAVLAGTTTLGVVAQALILVPVLRRTGFRWRPRRGFRGVGLRSAGQVAGWTFGAAASSASSASSSLSRIANSAGQEAGRGRHRTVRLRHGLPAVHAAALARRGLAS